MSNPYGIPARWSKATMSTIDIVDVLAYADDFQHNVKEGQGLILAGPPGVGKSWALAALTRLFRREALQHPDVYPSRDYVYITAPDFFDLVGVVEPAIDDFRRQDYVTTFGRVPFLVVNDLGKEYRGGKLSEQIPHKLGRILRTRSENMLPTFMSTNLDVHGIRETYGDSITSLMRENMTVVLVGGEDRRRKALRPIPGRKKAV